MYIIHKKEEQENARQGAFLHSFWLSFTRALQYPYIQGTSLKQQQHNKIQNSRAATSYLQLKDITALTSPKLGYDMRHVVVC